MSLFSKETVQDMVKERERSAAENKEDPDYESLFPLPAGKSLGLFGQDSWIRQVSAIIVDHPTFDNTVLILIVISSVLLAMDSPLNNPDTDFYKFCAVSDHVL